MKTEYKGFVIYIDRFGNIRSFNPNKNEKSLNEPISQHKKGNKVYINGQAIEKVKFKRIGNLNTKVNLLIQKTHKDILKYARDYNNSNEVGCVIDLTKSKRSNMVKGAKNRIVLESDTSISHMFRTYKPNTLVICHNHPGLSYFSKNDIEEFIGRNPVKTMTIVTNNGKVMYIDKNEKYNGQKAINEYKMLLKKYPSEKQGDKLVKEFLKISLKMGIWKG